MRNEGHEMTAKSMIRVLGQSYLAWLVFLVGMVLTSAAWYFVSAWEKEQARQEFTVHVKDTLNAVQQRLDTYIDILYGARGLFAHSDAVTRDEWRRYTTVTDLAVHHPGVHSFAFVRYVPSQEKSRFEKRVRGDTSVNGTGYPGFAISPPGERNGYFPIEYVEPETRYRNLLGVDRGALPDTREALERARDSGQPAASGRLHSPVENLETSRFFLIVLPIYRNGANPASVMERRAALVGFVTARVELETMLKGVVSTGVMEELFFELYDGGSVVEKTPSMTRENLLYAVEAGKTLRAGAAAQAARFTHQAEINVAGRNWLFFFGSRAGFSSASGYLPIVVLLGGAVTSVLMFAIVLMLVVQRQRVMGEVIRQKSLFSQVLDALPVNIFLKDKDFRFVLANEETARTLGVPKETVVGKTDFEWLPHEAAAGLRGYDEHVRSVERLVIREERLVSKGQEKIMLAGKQIIRLPGSSEPMLLGFSFDISDRKKAERELEQQQRFIRQVIDNIPSVIFVKDEKGDFLLVNQSGAAFWGMTPEQIVGRNQAEIFPDGREVDFVSHVDRLVIDERKSVDMEESIVLPNGEIVWLSMSKRPLPQPDGKVHVLAIATDITERKHLEEKAARARANELSRSLADAVGVGLIGVDASHHIIFANPKAQETLDFAEAGMQGKKLDDVVQAITADGNMLVDGTCPAWEMIAAGRTFQTDDWSFRRSNGNRFPVSLVVAPMFDNEKAAGAVLSFQDISARHASEMALTQHMVELARLNAELDEFTYVASHDLQEPVRKLVAFSELLRKDMGDGLPQRAEQDLGFIVDAVQRMQRLVQDLLTLSRTGNVSMVREQLALDDAVNRALDALELRIAESGATISRVPLPMVRGDLTLLAQLYQNLIGNALKFAAPRRPEISLTAEQVDGEWVFGVRDNGIGIDPKYMDQIFQPFKRLHGRGQYEGSGVGLSICRKVVERHFGRIWVESEENRGAWFKFTLGKQYDQ
jgi:PAS domain S-box-containing protein